MVKAISLVASGAFRLGAHAIDGVAGEAADQRTERTAEREAHGSAENFAPDGHDRARIVRIGRSCRAHRNLLPSPRARQTRTRGAPRGCTDRCRAV